MTELRDDPFYRALLEEETASLAEALGPSAALEDRVIETLRNLEGGGPTGGGGSSSSAGFTTAAAGAAVAVMVAGLFAFWPASAPAPSIAPPPSATAVVELNAPGETALGAVVDAPPSEPTPPEPPAVVEHEVDEPRGREAVAKVARARPLPRPDRDEKAAPHATAPTSTTEQGAQTEVAAPASRLAEQLFAYDAAQYALTRGRFDVAVLMFTEFLDQYPDSDLRAEAELSRLEALVRAGDHKEAARFAETLSKDEARPRRGDILRLQGDSLTALGECDRAAWVYSDALRLGARGLSADDVERATASCR